MKKTFISSADNPDLDWSQVRETVLMLNLAVAQIERSMRGGDDSVTSLAKLFIGMAEKINAIKKVLDELPAHEVKPFIGESCKDLSESMQTAIVSFQFYDRFSQRISHVCNSLASLGELIDDPQRLYNPREWSQLQSLIRSKYNIDIDRQMFDALLKGASVEQAMALEENCKKKTEEEDNIELF